MNYIEVTYFQEKKADKSTNIGFQKKATTNEELTESALYDWMFNNLEHVFLNQWQGKIRFQLPGPINIIILTKQGTVTKKRYYLCRDTKDETLKKFNVGAIMYTIEDCSQQPKNTPSSFFQILNNIEYRTIPKNKKKGPERPNPFRN